MTVYLKALGPRREAINGGTGVWAYRKWTEPTPPVPCESGWHVCTPVQMLDWLPETTNHLWLVEVRGEVVDHGDKTVAESARLVRRLDWSDRTARLFAADCAEHVLPIFEAERPGDLRPREAIAVARRFAAGGATDEELADAWAAAWAAAGAARDAGAAGAARAAWAAAAWAAWAAAAWAARDARAARDAARDTQAAEREWQADRLLHWIGAELGEASS